MGALHTKWKEAKNKVGGIDSLFKKNLGGQLDKAESTYADFKKYETDLPKMVTNVGKVKTECDKAIAIIKDYEGVIANTKAKPSKTKAIALFMDKDKATLKTALKQISTTLTGYKAEAGSKKMPTVDEVKNFKANHTKSALKMAGL